MFVPLLAAAAVTVPELGPAAAIPATALVVLGLAALVFARRRARPTRLVEILETASLGPKRSLIVARIGGETLILGASEAGISLLGSRPGAAAAKPPAPSPAPARPVARPAAADLPATSTAPMAPAPSAAAPLPPPLPPAPPAAAGPRLLGRLGVKKTRVPGGFEPLLRESLEDQELRAKVAAGVRGTVA